MVVEVLRGSIVEVGVKLLNVTMCVTNTTCKMKHKQCKEVEHRAWVQEACNDRKSSFPPRHDRSPLRRRQPSEPPSFMVHSSKQRKFKYQSHLVNDVPIRPQRMHSNVVCYANHFLGVLDRE